MMSDADLIATLRNHANPPFASFNQMVTTFRLAADRIEALVRELNEIRGTPSSVAHETIRWAHDLAEQKFGRSPASSRPPHFAIVEGIERLERELAAANAVALSDEAIEVLLSHLLKSGALNTRYVNVYGRLRREISSARGRSVALQSSDEAAVADCHDCSRQYGDEHGFPDLIIPFDAWRRITPTSDDGGLLCPSCICKRLHAAGIRCEGAFMSGPIESVSRPTMSALRRVENIELAIAGRDNAAAAVREPVTSHPVGDQS